MRFKDFLKELHSPELAKLDANIRARKLAQMYDGKPFKIKMPVKVGNKTETREFIIDNTLEQRRVMSSFKEKGLIDLSKVENDSKKHGDKASYAFNDPLHSASIPKRLHGLPAKTRRKSGYAPEDLRREVYDA